ncbi:MAG: heparinase II/III family protein [Candidatus Sumerlaeota bacterium]
MVKLEKIGQVWRTLKHLRPVQMRGQVTQRARRRVEMPARLVKIAGKPLPPPVSALAGDFSVVPPVRPRGEKEQLTRGAFTFLNQQHELGWPPDWNNQEVPKLWQYHLHYHDWLWSLPFSKASEAALDWYRRHPLERGAVGWEAYPTSLRLMNWTALFWGYWRSRTLADRASATVLWAALRLQVEWLMRHLETHLMGNHLLENGAALAFVGATFDGPLAERWKRRGMDILRQEIPEQILADGMHFELSPMYHQRLVQVLLWLHATGDDDLVELTVEPLHKTFKALHHTTHPDGGVALLNDSALRVYPSLSTLLRQAERQGVYIQSERDSGLFAQPLAGYYGARTEAGDYVICDAARVGPDYIPGHAHGDMLSFELSLGGKRMLVDSGVHDYERGEMRDYCRSTRAHNTVEIDGHDQCEFWAAFRVGHRGRPRDVRYEASPEDGGFVLEAWHDGYLRLDGAPRHWRKFEWRAGALLIEDSIESDRSVQAVSRLHLHPDCELHTMRDNIVSIERDGVICHIHFSGPGSLEIESAWYCPRFGQKRESQLLAWTVRADSARWRTSIEWERKSSGTE